MLTVLVCRCGQGDGGQPDMCGSPFQGEANKPSMTSVYYGEYVKLFCVYLMEMLNAIIVNLHKLDTSCRSSPSLPPAGPQATYTQGSVIVVKTNYTANHAGRFSLSLCPLSRGQVTQACFDNPANFLVRADGPYAGKRYYYLTGHDVTDGKMSVVSNWRLPSNLNCPEGCMLQWWWLGYQVRGALASHPCPASHPRSECMLSSTCHARFFRFTFNMITT